MYNTFYSNNDYRSYLQHYGVLGMKWGVHKAKQYERDVAVYEKRKRARSNLSDYLSRKISKEEYKKNALKNKNIYNKTISEIKNMYAGKKPKKDSPVSSLYSKSKEKAYAKIPHYALKTSLKNIAKVIGVAGLSYSAVLQAGSTTAARTATFLASHPEYATIFPEGTLSGTQAVRLMSNMSQYQHTAAVSSALKTAIGVGGTTALRKGIDEIDMRRRVKHSDEDYYNAKFQEFKESGDYLEHFKYAFG